MSAQDYSYTKKEESEKFKKFFLLEFTKELIRHYAPSEVLELESVLKEQKKDEKKKIKTEISRKKTIQDMSKPELRALPKKILYKRPPLPKVLNIPKPKLPPYLQYLKPTPSNTQVDLGRLNIFVRDPFVESMECNGPGENVIVNGKMGAKETNITLNKEDIDRVIKKFSEASMIPIHEGIYRVAVGRLILTAIISEVVNTKFIIKKMMYSPEIKR